MVQAPSIVSLRVHKLIWSALSMQQLVAPISPFLKKTGCPLIWIFISILADTVVWAREAVKVSALGDDTMVFCQSPDKFIPHYVGWHKGRTPIKDMGPRFVVNSKSGTLTINQVKIEDEGNYTCSAIYGRRFEPFTVTLKVAIAPRILETSIPVAPSIGDKLSIFCNVSGRPRPSVKWFSSQQLVIDKNTTEAGSRFSIQERQSKDTEIESYLVIAPVLAKDRGVFVCDATNLMSSDRASVVVDVQQKATMLSPTEDVLVYWWEGHKVNLTCQATGNPAPVLKWTSFDEQDRVHQMPLTPIVEVKRGIEVISSINLPLDRLFHLPATFKCRAENRYGVTQVHKFDVREGFPPLSPVVSVVSIKDDELVMSISIPWQRDSPPVQYVAAHYRLQEARREMDASTVFTGNGTLFAIRGIMLYYKYVIKVMAVNTIGASEDTVLHLYAEPKSSKSTTTSPTDTAKSPSGIEPSQTGHMVNSNTSTHSTSDTHLDSRPRDGDMGRTLKSQIGNNSCHAVFPFSISLVIPLLCSIARLILR